MTWCPSDRGATRPDLPWMTSTLRESHEYVQRMPRLRGGIIYVSSQHPPPLPQPPSPGVPMAARDADSATLLTYGGRKLQLRALQLLRRRCKLSIVRALQPLPLDLLRRGNEENLWCTRCMCSGAATYGYLENIEVSYHCVFCMYCCHI